MAALDGTTPAHTFDELAGKVLARTEEPMEADVSTPDATAGGPPPRTEDSGLHDIKALARTTRQRVSKRITSQHDIDDSWLESSHSGLRVVALPEPARLVSLPSVEEVMSTSTAPAVVRAAHAVANDQGAQKRKGVPVWAIGGVAAAAAAALAFVVIGGGSKKTESAAAGSGSAMAQDPTALRGAANGSPRADVAAIPATAAPTAAVASGSAAGSGSAADPTGAGSAVAVAAAGSAAEAAPPPPSGTGAIAHTDTARGGGSGDDHHAVKGAPHDGTKPPADKPITATKPDKGAGGAAPGGGAKSLDQLIDDAAGGPTTGGGGSKAPEKAVLDKKELTSNDIRKGMGSATSTAKACFDQFGVAGTVGVRAVVAPSGQVTKVVATGSFAGTPTGSCVAAAVQGVSFPPWDGAPMTINYSYLLSE
ncbi:MAG: hypothetical protein K8W52_40545 [Deltaproteobacteria bacterium]|nr:hypothetical protein [Deltaproteobacteria bacterium]